jgi:hypothetical protein
VDPAEKAISVGLEGLETLDVKVRWGWSGDAVRKIRAVAVPEGASGERERSSAAVARIVK